MKNFKSLPVQVTDRDCWEVNLSLVSQVDAGYYRVGQIVFDDINEVVECHEGEESEYGDPVEEP